MVGILGANSVSGGYEIDNSLRLNDDDTPRFDKTLGTPTNTDKFTASFWFKKCKIAAAQTVFGYDSGGTAQSYITFTSDDKLEYYNRLGSGNVTQFTTNRLFRDVSAWYHIVVAVDSTDGTAGDRCKIYVNGVRETSFATSNFADQNQNQNLNSALAIRLFAWSSGEQVDGYISELHFIDGAAKAPTDFGETNDNGVWIPINYSGTYGDNGYRFEFKQTGTDADASGIGADTSGETNHWAVTNLAATDVTTDTPTNNFCTLNSLDIDSTLPTLAEGNLDYHSANGTAFNPVRSTMAVTKGKWYAEWKYINTAGFLGVITTQSPLTGNIVSDANVRSVLRIPAGFYGVRNNSGSGTDIGDNSQTFSDDDIGQVALDMDNGYVYFGINGTYLKGNDGSTTGNPAGNNGSAGGSANHVTQLMTDQHDGVIAFMAGDFTQNTTGQIQCNFGNPPYAISSGNTDGEGYGNFEFAPPSGFFALCTKNLAKYG
mgnify:FL=1